MDKLAITSQQFARLIEALVFPSGHDASTTVSGTDARAIEVARYVVHLSNVVYPNLGEERSAVAPASTHQYAATTIIGPHPPKILFAERITSTGPGWTTGPHNAPWDALTAVGLPVRDLALIASQFQIALDRGGDLSQDARNSLEEAIEIIAHAIFGLTRKRRA